MCPVVSLICVISRACLAMYLYMSSSCRTVLAVVYAVNLCGSLLWSSYLQFACLVELCRSLLCCLFSQFSAQPFPPLIGSVSLLLLGQVSFSTEVPSVWQCLLVAACRASSHSQGCRGTSLLYLVFSRNPYQLLIGTSSQAHQVVMSLINITCSPRMCVSVRLQLCQGLLPVS